MTLTKIGTWTSPVSGEADRPNRTAAEMKAVFDANSNQIRTAFNKLCDDLEVAAAAVKVDGTHPDRYLSLDGTYTTPAVGEAANGVRTGGIAGQVYVKRSASDYDGEWRSIRPAATAEELPLAAWSGGTACTLTLPGRDITAASIVFVAPEAEDHEAWTAKGVRCTAAGEDALSFACDETPDGTLSFALVVWNY